MKIYVIAVVVLVSSICVAADKSPPAIYSRTDEIRGLCRYVTYWSGNEAQEGKGVPTNCLELCTYPSSGGDPVETYRLCFSDPSYEHNLRLFLETITKWQKLPNGVTLPAVMPIRATGVRCYMEHDKMFMVIGYNYDRAVLLP